MGGFDARFFDQQWPQFQRRIMDHIDKVDFVPVDSSGFSQAQASKVQDFVDQLGSQVFTVE